MQRTSMSMISGPETPRTLRGFTLIEILVVVLLVGLVVTLVAGNRIGNSQRQAVSASVSDLFRLMQLASEQALLNNQEMGLRIEGRRYQFLVYSDGTGQWRKAEDRVFRERRLPGATNIRQAMAESRSGLRADSDPTDPDVVFFSSGDTTPFRIEIYGDPGAAAPYVLASDGLGAMTLTPPGDGES